jgi:hypothetical protein
MDYREIIEREGCEFLGVENGCVAFRDPQTGLRLSLYTFSCDEECVRLTLKNTRTPTVDFPPLLPTE